MTKGAGPHDISGYRTYREVAEMAKTSPTTAMAVDNRFLAEILDWIFQQEEPMALLVQLCQELVIKPEFIAKKLTPEQRSIMADYLV